MAQAGSWLRVILFILFFHLPQLFIAFASELLTIGTLDEQIPGLSSYRTAIGGLFAPEAFPYTAP
jgi:hypothetical protein